MNIWNTDTLTDFSNKLYDGLLRREHIVSNEVAKKYNDVEFHGYVLEKDDPETNLKDRYFVKTDYILKLPFKVDSFTKFSFRSEVFKFVNHCSTMKIPSRQDMTPTEMIKFYANYSHSNPYHFNIAKKIVLAGYFERLNTRIISPASFGKDALVNILQVLNGNLSKIQNATFALCKQEIAQYDTIVINEVGNLNKQEKSDMQKYLLAVGDYSPFFQNNSLSVGKARNKVSLINKSHIVYHNTPDYYRKNNQLYFEQMFTPAIIDRFPGLLMQGYVTEDFSKAEPIESFPEQDITNLKRVIASLNWYKENPVTEPKYKIDDEFWGFKGKEKQRSLRSFKIISKWLSHFNGSESEFLTDCEILNKCRLDYKDMIEQYKDEEPVRYNKEELIKDD